MVGTVLTAAMTIVAGAAIFGYVNGQAGTASQAYGQQVGNSVQYLEEKFTVVDMSWSTNTVTVWIYNTGKIQLSLFQVRLYDSAKTLNLLYNYSAISGSTVNRIHDILSTSTSGCSITITSTYENPLISGSGSFSAVVSYTSTIALTVPPLTATPTGQTCHSFGQSDTSGDTYFVAVVGAYGNSYTFSEVG